ncbi:MAG: hypothetical protein J7K23_02045 [Thermoproteales archaeon]|nr:hypothetical protein [Thermoproteales archaeon]
MLKAVFLGDGRLRVSNGFWEVVHDSGRGGCITDIRFIYGSGKNLLVDPIISYFGEYMDVFDDSAVLQVVKEDSKSVVVYVNGVLKNKDKRDLGIRYEYVYEYRNEYVKIIRKYMFDKGIAGIWRVGVGCFSVRSELNEYAVRSSHIYDSSRSRVCPAKWGRTRPGTEYRECNIPLYVALFDRGMEGIEFLPGSDLSEWFSQLVDEPNNALFEIRNDGDRVGVVLEPFRSRIGGYSGILLSGTYVFTTYIGLPNIRKFMPRRYMHLMFTNHPWPSDEEIREWAYRGVTVVRLHNDYHPSGDFWHDGSWPPYDEYGMRELRRVIDTCHQYGIRIVPYFSLAELNPKSDAFADGYIVWRRSVDGRNTIIETGPPSRYYGFMMCLKSGWKDFLKKYVRKVVETLGFDGVYYDYAHYWYCDNKLHSKSPHTAVDDLFDFLEWTRELVKKRDGVLLLHASAWVPSIIVENFADGHIMFEDQVRHEDIPDLEDFHPHILFMNVAPKIPCPITAAIQKHGDDALWELCAKSILLGVFPHGRMHESLLSLFESFRAFDLGKFRFAPYMAGYVKTDNDAVKGAVYYNDDMMLVVLANIDGGLKRFRWKLDVKGLGFGGVDKFFLVDSLGKSIRIVDLDMLTDDGIEDSLDGFRFRVYVLRRFREERIVLFNTRSWCEEFVDGRLVVRSSGPEGQRAVLKIYSPDRPKRVELNSNILEEGESWRWDPSMRVCIINYRYRNTGETVTIVVE